MYCRACGNQIADHCGRCPYCGQLTGRGQPSPPYPPPYGQPPPGGRSVRGELLRRLVGSNSSYYLEQFSRLDSGERAHFNWPAFLFSGFFYIYRKCYALFFKITLPFMIVYLASCVPLGIALRDLNDTLLGAIVIALFVFSLVYLAVTIVVGFRFNAHYYKRLQRIIDDNHLTPENLDGHKQRAVIERYGDVFSLGALLLGVAAFLYRGLCVALLLLPVFLYGDETPPLFTYIQELYGEQRQGSIDQGDADYTTTPWPSLPADYDVNGYELVETTVAEVRRDHADEITREYRLEKGSAYGVDLYVLELQKGETLYYFCEYGNDVEAYFLWEVYTTAPDSVGPRGIKVGDHLDDVMAKFPKADPSDDGEGIFYEYIDYDVLYRGEYTLSREGARILLHKGSSENGTMDWYYSYAIELVDNYVTVINVF